MYRRIDVVADAVRRAEAPALRDRQRYRPFLEQAERFAAEQGLVVGGASATRLLLGDPGDPSAPPPVGLNSFQYDFLAERPAAAARGLARAFHAVDPEGLGHYAVARPLAAGERYAVAVDTRDLCYVTALPMHRGVRTADVVLPAYRPAQFATTSAGRPLRLACLGPSLQLISVYGALCDPSRAGDWGELLATERALRALFSRQARPQLAEVVARARASKRGGGAGGAARLGAALRQHFAPGAGRVVVGPEALALLLARGGDGPLQVVTERPLEAEAREVAALAASLGVAIHWAVEPLRLPSDPRLVRLAVAAVEGGRREPVLDVFNAAAFELVPFVAPPVAGGRRRGGPRRSRGEEDGAGRPDGRPPAEAGEGAPAGLRLGTPFALLRFRLVDFWTAQLLLHLGALDEARALARMRGILDDFDAAAALLEEGVAAVAEGAPAAGAAERLLPTTAYIGRLEDAALAARRAAVERPPPPFFPAGEERRGAAGKKEPGGRRPH